MHLSKQQKLDNARVELKKQFIGIDSVIDSVIDSIRVWYLHPEFVQRPTIINLYGMTGSGKTDLVRKLSTLLGMSEALVEVNPETMKRKFATILDEIMENAFIHEGDPFIFHFDEFQKFRTIDDNGVVRNSEIFGDFWELISDGFLNKPKIDYDEIENIIYFAERNEFIEQQNLTAAEKAEVTKFGGFYSIRRLCKVLGVTMSFLKEAFGKIDGIDYKDVLDLVKNRAENGLIKSTFDCSKSLVFISANLDSLYSYASIVDNADLDPDVVKIHSLGLNNTDVKRVLSGMFRPEQISRLGNKFIIYPAFGKQEFYELIDLKLNDISNRCKKFNIDLLFSESVREFIFRNGVYPTQGVRPLFSTITNQIENLIPAVLELCSDLNVNNPVLGIIDNNFTCFGRTINKATGDLDVIRDSVTENVLYNIAVHEAGHAVVFGVLQGVAPTSVKIGVASGSSEGFVTPINVYHSYSMVFKQLAMLQAGLAAERLVFNDHMSSGAAGDLRNATAQAVASVRYSGHFYNYYLNKENFDIEFSDNTVKSLLDSACAKATSVIINHKKLFEAIVLALIEKKILTDVEICEIFASHGVDIRTASRDEILTPEYKKLFDNFINFPVDKLAF